MSETNRKLPPARRRELARKAIAKRWEGHVKLPKGYRFHGVRRITPGSPGWLSPRPGGCGAEHPTENLMCTRTYGHRGDHAAHSMDGMMQFARWQDKKESRA